MTTRPRFEPIPEVWDRGGLPAWTYRSPAILDLERRHVFLNHWQVAGHVSDIPAPGDWLTFDILGDRGLVIRGEDGIVRAFHNLCRHRGARVVDGARGQCRSALVCPFHGWVYNTDGTLRGASRPDTFDAGFDRADFGLSPIEMEIWHGFVFLRFLPGPQPSVAETLAPFDADFAAYDAAGLLPAMAEPWDSTLPVNWKSVRDVDNEGYHVALAHPGLQDLYGRTYVDRVLEGGLSFSTGTYGDRPGRLWSVRNYIAASPGNPDLPEHLSRAWTYYGLFPNTVFAFTPEGGQMYQDIPLGVRETLLRGRLYRRPNEGRRERLARYLAMRIDRETGFEDRQLAIWSDESMASTAFEGFHLSDLEYGVRRQHDRLRALLPVMRLADAPPEERVAALNEDSALGKRDAESQ